VRWPLGNRTKDAGSKPKSWRRFVVLFFAAFVEVLAAAYVFILLVDPYDIIPFSLPLDRRIVSISFSFMYPQVVRSRRFDSYIIGTSTSRLIDPEILNGPFQARFTNLAMNSMLAWEQKTMVDYFQRHVGPPKVLIVGIDLVWCAPDADTHRHNPVGWPDWIYDDNPWNDYLYLLNSATFEIAVRLVGFQLGLYRERIRFDGYEEFTPPEQTYDVARARQLIWDHRPRATPPDLPPPPLSETERQALSFPALRWLDEILTQMPATTRKVLVYMPVHVATQPWPGTREAAVEADCKARIADIARKTGSKVIDWRISSPLTREDANYWDRLHYRLPIAQKIARELPPAVLEDRQSADGSYRLTVR